MHAPIAVLDALRAFAGGRLSLFVVRTLVEGPVLVLWLLALLLVPWTIALALADGAFWFPSPAVKFAWVAFDIWVCVAMAQLARRFELWLAVPTALAVSADVVLSWIQVVAWNAHRVRGMLDAAILVVGCAAPALAAAVLWRGIHRERHRVRS